MTEQQSQFWSKALTYIFIVIGVYLIFGYFAKWWPFNNSNKRINNLDSDCPRGVECNEKENEPVAKNTTSFGIPIEKVPSRS